MQDKIPLEMKLLERGKENERGVIGWVTLY